MAPVNATAWRAPPAWTEGHNNVQQQQQLLLRPLSHPRFHQLPIGLRFTATSIPGARDAPDELQISRPPRPPVYFQALRCELSWCFAERPTWRCGCRVVSLVKVTARGPRPHSRFPPPGQPGLSRFQWWRCTLVFPRRVLP
ncbi:hypothetical protein E2C01_059355 [Portunus trituberculatus]|uniref:Uncharacterized protein n=1 Tax=Portunus trituberculatus TaxID=210409 RepID=A0A5B7H546_PORTR|nr:hypothetical protein [Portunus trituberculatus]